jgi:hypothetical protein
MPAFSPSTLNVFAELLNSYSLPANHPQFEQIAQAISLAKRELAQALAEQPETNADTTKGGISLQDDVPAAKRSKTVPPPDA